MVMDKNVTISIAGFVVIIVGFIICINEALCPFGILFVIAGFGIIILGCILPSGGW